MKMAEKTDSGKANSYPCPSCGFLEFSNPPGSYDICSICSWQDDGVQLANPSSGGGANEMSLAESQKTALEEFPLTKKNTPDGTARSDIWRPLNQLEIEVHQQEVSEQRSNWTREGIVNAEECYWNKFFAYLGNPANGWMEVLIRHPEASLDFDASHVFDDSIKLLVKALHSILKGESRTEAIWHLEPAVYEFVFDKKDEEILLSDKFLYILHIVKTTK